MGRIDLPCKTIECDEIWTYCNAKKRNVPEEHKGTYGYGDVWTYTALCADTKRLHFMHYNFARSHQALKERHPRTPAMAAGVADHITTTASDSNPGEHVAFRGRAPVLDIFGGTGGLLLAGRLPASLRSGYSRFRLTHCRPTWRRYRVPP